MRKVQNEKYSESLNMHVPKTFQVMADAFRQSACLFGRQEFYRPNNSKIVINSNRTFKASAILNCQLRVY